MPLIPNNEHMVIYNFSTHHYFLDRLLIKKTLNRTSALFDTYNVHNIPAFQSSFPIAKVITRQATESQLSQHVLDYVMIKTNLKPIPYICGRKKTINTLPITPLPKIELIKLKLAQGRVFVFSFSSS